MAKRRWGRPPAAQHGPLDGYAHASGYLRNVSIPDMGGKMKRALFGAFLALTSLVATAAFAGKQDFELVNKTGYDISHVYVSPTKSDDWEEDVLGKDVLEDGDSWDIAFDRSEKTCKWDLKVVYADDDSSAYWRGIDLCSVRKITIKYNRKTDTTSATLN